VSYFQRFPIFGAQYFEFGAQYVLPNLTTLDFYLWAWMKSEVYRRKVDTRKELLNSTMDAIARIKDCQDELRRATCHVLTRDAKCTDVDGGIFEMYYKLTNLSLEQ
jgi:hypothetical protein